MSVLIAAVIVSALSVVVSFRRARSLPQTRRGRLAALWPALVAAFVALGLIEFNRAQVGQEPGPSATMDLLVLVTFFFGGWFIGAIGGMVD